MNVTVEYKKGTKFHCPNCNGQNVDIYDRETRSWRHLNHFEHDTYIHARVPRVWCHDCSKIDGGGVRSIEIPWARKRGHFSYYGGKSDWGYPYHDQQAQMKFTSALLDLNKINPNQNALIINGDVTTTGMQSDYDYMNKVLQSNRHPPNTLFTMGNHEFYSAVRDKHGRRNTEAFPNGATEAQCIHRFLKNTGTPNVYYDTWIQGYHFIMLGSEQSIITNGRRGDGAFLSQTQLEWLRKRLMGSAGGRPIFVFLHEPIPYTVDGSTWRDIVNPNKLKSILSKYPQVIFFSGHSHRTLKWQTHAMYRNGFTMFNDSSVRNPVDAHNRLMGDSEGLYVQVYDDKVVVKGRDFTHKVWINQYTVPIPHFNP